VARCLELTSPRLPHAATGDHARQVRLHLPLIEPDLRY